MITVRAKSERTIVLTKDFLKLEGYLVKSGHNNTEIEVNADEGKLRLLLQHFIDDNKIKDWILVDGNTVWSFDKIVKEMKRIKKSGSTAKISNYFYDFMSLNFTIAHYNKEGWISVYPSYSDVMKVLKRERGGIPSWHTDLVRIVNFILNGYDTEAEVKTEVTEVESINLFNVA